MYGNVLFLWSIKYAESKFVEMGFEKCSGKNATKNISLIFALLHFFQCFMQNFWKHILSPYYWIWNQHNSLVFYVPYDFCWKFLILSCVLAIFPNFVRNILKHLAKSKNLFLYKHLLRFDPIPFRKLKAHSVYNSIYCTLSIVLQRRKKPPPWRRENLWMQYKSLTLVSRKSVLRGGGCEVGSGDFQA